MSALQDWFDTQAFYALLVLVLLCLPLAVRLGRGGRTRGTPPSSARKRRNFWHRR